jgi:hypothetical protein
LGKDIRKYMTGEFYDHHIKFYKKRPIYWLFSSPKKSFNALIYMHRYRPDTSSVVLNSYLREYIHKLDGRKSHLSEIESNPSSSNRDKAQAQKELAKLAKITAELSDYERELYNTATQQIDIDLDDGVLVNYNKFPGVLRKVTGLTGK